MKFKDIARRVTGLSCPIFGIEWNPPLPESETARKVIVYLEDKRVLYNPYEMESPSHCMESVIQMREYLTSSIADLSAASKLSETLRGMRASCRRFLDKTQAEWYFDKKKGRIEKLGMSGEIKFYNDMGVFRGEMGVFIVHILIMYGIDCESDLLKIVPLTLPED
jgi:hypothetical protein